MIQVLPSETAEFNCMEMHNYQAGENSSQVELLSNPALCLLASWDEDDALIPLSLQRLNI